MTDVSSNPFVDAANAGLSPIPVDTSTKRPKVAWKTYQESPADLLQLHDWADENIGIVCGQVSGRLICLDFEAGFMDQLDELVRRLKAAGAYETFYQWIGGYCEDTARGGMHVLVRLEGEGPTEGNRKLAMASPTEVLIETRGEGGYVVVAPSMNGERGWKLLHGGFDQIAYATLEEWEEVAAVLRSFDAAPPPSPTVESRSTPSLSPMLRGDSWIDQALASLPTMERTLEDLGWEQVGQDQYGTHWTRPGKNPREGHSASVSHEKHRLWVHSTNAGLPTNVSMDVLDVIFCMDGRQTLPSLDERTAYLRNFYNKVPRHQLGDEVDQFLQLRPTRPGGEAGERTTQEAGPVDPTLYLGDDFWQARPWLAALRDAALGRMLSPDAVLGAFLSAYATTVPMGIWVPAVVGAEAPLNIYSTIVAVSGGGKTAAMTVASDLLGPVLNPDVRLGNSLRSGEGLITLVLKPVKKRRGEEEQFEPSFNAAVQVHFDEGGTLGKQSERAGSTTIPYLNTAWSGAGIVGGAKASDSAGFPAKQVRICAVMGVQYGAAANLFTGEAERLGFPQRLLYFGNDNPILESIDVDTMSSLPIVPLNLPIYQHSEFTRHPQRMAVPANIEREVRTWTRDKTVHGLDNSLDGHQMNLRLRVASLFALTDGEGRFNISDEDWALAFQLETASRSIRRRLVQSLGNLSLEQARQRGRLDAIRQDASLELFLERAALSLARKVQSSKEPITKRQAKDHLRPFKQRHQIDYLSAIELAIERRWVLSTGDGGLVSGPVRVGGSGGS